MDLSKNILFKYENKWIIIDKSYKNVLAAHEKLDDLQKDIKRLKIRDSIIMYVPPFNSILAPRCLLKH